MAANPKTETTQPFGQALLSLMDEEGLTYRQVAERLKSVDYEKQTGIAHATLSPLINGKERVSLRVMQLVARAFGLEPHYFVEYRLAAARDDLDPAKVGLEQAVKNLDAVMQAQTRDQKRRRRR